MRAEGTQAPLKADVVLLLVLVLDEVVVLLVDGVVGQVHELVVLVDLGGVGLRGETRKAFLVDVDLKGLVAGHQHVDAQVEFVPIDKEWVGDIPGDN